MVTVLIFGLQVVANLAFAASGVAKNKLFVDQFKEFGLPTEFMYFIGLLEVSGSIGLWVGFLRLRAFSGLASLMIGATMNHLKAKHPLARFVPPVGLFCLCVAGAFLS
jgi:uncharacterized membrane protein YphA (DoxX/SURF4 family)